MTDPLDLIRRLAREERELLAREFVAACFPGVGRVRVRVSGLVYEFRIESRPAVGIGVFRPVSAGRADWVREAAPEQVEGYLACFPEVRALSAVEEGGWHGVPADAAAAARAGFAGPVPLVEMEGFARDRVSGPFEAVAGPFDGARVWVRRLDPKADLDKQEALRAALRALDRPAAERVKGLTAEDRVALGLAFVQREEAHRMLLDVRVRQTLASRGASLRSLREFADGRVEIVWASRAGDEYRTLLRREDLSIVSAGICLSAQDTRFDLASLVGVVHQGEERGAIVEMDIDAARAAHPGEEP